MSGDCNTLIRVRGAQRPRKPEKWWHLPLAVLIVETLFAAGTMIAAHFTGPSPLGW